MLSGAPSFLWPELVLCVSSHSGVQVQCLQLVTPELTLLKDGVQSAGSEDLVLFLSTQGFSFGGLVW